MPLRQQLRPWRRQPPPGQGRPSQWALDRKMVSALDPFGSLLGAGGFSGYRNDYQLYPRRAGMATWGRTASGVAYERRELNLSYPLSYVTVCAGLTRNNGTQVISGFGRLGTTNILGFQAGTGQATRLIMRQDGGTAPMTIEYGSAYNAPVSVDDIVVLGMSLQSFSVLAAQSSIYWNGQLATRGSSSSGSAGQPIYDTHGIGGIYRSATSETAGGGTNILLSALFGSALSPDDHAAIARNWLILYEPQRIWVPVAAALSGATLLPPLLSSSSTVRAPVVVAGAVSLAPALLANASALNAPAVSRGSVSVAPQALTNAQAFYAPAIVPGAASVEAPLVANVSGVHAPLISTGSAALQPPLVQSAGEIRVPVVVPGAVEAAAPLLANERGFHAPSVSMGGAALQPPLLVNAPGIFAAAVSAGAVEALPPLLASTQIFYGPLVSGGSVVHPPRSVSSSRRVICSPLARTVRADAPTRRVLA